MASDLLRELTGVPDVAVVDAHQHFWDLEGGRYPWLQNAYRGDTFMGDYRRLRTSYGPAQYLADMQGLHIAATVHVEAERAREESLDETISLKAIADRYEGLATAVVPWVDLWSDDVAERVDAHLDANNRVKAVRAKPQFPSSSGLAPDPQLAHGLRDPRLSRGLKSLVERKLGWDLRVPWFQLAEAAERLTDVPDLCVAINHAGLPWDRSEVGLLQWQKSMAALADLPNVYVKLSEFSTPTARWNARQVRRIIDTVLDLFGAQRCMFASNFPVAGLAVDVITLVRTIADAVAPRGEQALRSVFMKTACNVYRIDPASLQLAQ